MGEVYKYTSNKDPMDGTEEIRLEGRAPVPMGGEVELTEEEHKVLSQRLNLRKVQSDESEGQGNANQTEGDKSQS